MKKRKPLTPEQAMKRVRSIIDWCMDNGQDGLSVTIGCKTCRESHRLMAHTVLTCWHRESTLSEPISAIVTAAHILTKMALKPSVSSADDAMNGLSLHTLCEEDILEIEEMEKEAQS